MAIKLQTQDPFYFIDRAQDLMTEVANLPHTLTQKQTWDEFCKVGWDNLPKLGGMIAATLGGLFIKRNPLGRAGVFLMPMVWGTITGTGTQVALTGLLHGFDQKSFGDVLVSSANDAFGASMSISIARGVTMVLGALGVTSHIARGIAVNEAIGLAHALKNRDATYGMEDVIISGATGTLGGAWAPYVDKRWALELLLEIPREFGENILQKKFDRFSDGDLTIQNVTESFVLSFAELGGSIKGHRGGMDTGDGGSWIVNRESKRNFGSGVLAGLIGALALYSPEAAGVNGTVVGGGMVWISLLLGALLAMAGRCGPRFTKANEGDSPDDKFLLRETWISSSNGSAGNPGYVLASLTSIFQKLNVAQALKKVLDTKMKTGGVSRLFIVSQASGGTGGILVMTESEYNAWPKDGKRRIPCVVVGPGQEGKHEVVDYGGYNGDDLLRALSYLDYLDIKDGLLPPLIPITHSEQELEKIITNFNRLPKKVFTDILAKSLFHQAMEEKASQLSGYPKKLVVVMGIHGLFKGRIAGSLRVMTPAEFQVWAEYIGADKIVLYPRLEVLKPEATKPWSLEKSKGILAKLFEQYMVVNHWLQDPRGKTADDFELSSGITTCLVDPEKAGKMKETFLRVAKRVALSINETGRYRLIAVTAGHHDFQVMSPAQLRRYLPADYPSCPQVYLVYDTCTDSIHHGVSLGSGSSDITGFLEKEEWIKSKKIIDPTMKTCLALARKCLRFINHTHPYLKNFLTIRLREIFKADKTKPAYIVVSRSGDAYRFRVEIDQAGLRPGETCLTIYPHHDESTFRLAEAEGMLAEEALKILQKAQAPIMDSRVELIPQINGIKIEEVLRRAVTRAPLYRALDRVYAWTSGLSPVYFSCGMGSDGKMVDPSVSASQPVATEGRTWVALERGHGTDIWEIVEAEPTQGGALATRAIEVGVFHERKPPTPPQVSPVEAWQSLVARKSLEKILSDAPLKLLREALLLKRKQSEQETDSDDESRGEVVLVIRPGSLLLLTWGEVEDDVETNGREIRSAPKIVFKPGEGDEWIIEAGMTLGKEGHKMADGLMVHGLASDSLGRTNKQLWLKYLTNQPWDTVIKSQKVRQALHLAMEEQADATEVVSQKRILVVTWGKEGADKGLQVMDLEQYGSYKEGIPHDSHRLAYLIKNNNKGQWLLGPTFGTDAEEVVRFLAAHQKLAVTNSISPKNFIALKTTFGDTVTDEDSRNRFNAIIDKTLPFLGSPYCDEVIRSIIHLATKDLKTKKNLEQLANRLDKINEMITEYEDMFVFVNH